MGNSLIKFDKFVTCMNPAIMRKRQWSNGVNVMMKYPSRETHASHSNEQNAANFRNSNIDWFSPKHNISLQWIDAILNGNHWILFFSFLDFSNFWRTSIIFVGHWYSCYVLVVTSSFGAKGTLDPLLRVSPMHDRPHRITSECNTCQPPVDIHFSRLLVKQECIPVGCVPSSTVAVWGVSAQRGCLSRGCVCLEGVSA